MFNFTKKSASFTARTGLYRVWVPLRDGGRVPLVSIWIDSTMAASEPRPYQEGTWLPETNESVLADELEDPKRCIAKAAMRIGVVRERNVDMKGELQC
jgi:hypothetical protein